MRANTFKKIVGAATVVMVLLAQMVLAQTWRVGENEVVVMRRNGWGSNGGYMIADHYGITRASTGIVHLGEEIRIASKYYRKNR